MSVSRFALGDEIDLTREESLHHRCGYDAEFDRLYDEFSLRVIGLVRRFVADEDLIDDIVQETFLRAYNGGLHHEYRDEDRPHDQWPWLAAVARNLSLDHLRKKQVVDEEEIDEELFDLEVSPDDPESYHLAARRRSGIAEAFGAVCERQRDILILKHIHGMAYGDIAERQGMSVEAVKSALARARATFRNAYASIAERNGLGVVVGGVLARLQARLRSWRDRIAQAPDATANALAASPGAVNAVATLMVLGTVGVAGVVGSSAPTTSGPTPIAASSEPVVETVPPMADPTFETAAPVEEPAVEVEPTPAPEPVVHTEPAPEPASSSGETEAEAEVDTDEFVPVDDPPARGGAGGNLEKHGTTVEGGIDNDLDAGGDGDPESEGTNQFGAQCPPPEKRRAATELACPVLEEADGTLGDGSLM